jgi:hypothetical protein
VTTTYTQRFALGSQGPGAAVIYTTPSDGAVYVIRCITLGTVSTGASGEADLRVNGTVLIANLVTAGTSSALAVYDLRVVLHPADTLLLGSNINPITYSVTGYRLV